MLADGQAVPANTLAVAGEYEALVGTGLARLPVRRLRREHQGRDLLHDGHDRRPEGRVLQPPPDRAAHDGHRDGALRAARRAAHPSRRRVHADHADVPRARVGHPVHRGDARPEDRAARPLPARRTPETEAVGEGHVLALRARPFCRCCCRRPTQSKQDLVGLDDDHRRLGALARAVQGRTREGHRRLRRLRHVRDRSGRLGSRRFRPVSPRPMPTTTSVAARSPDGRCPSSTSASSTRRCATCRATARRRARSSCARPSSRRATSTSRRPPRSCGPVATCTRRTSR